MERCPQSLIPAEGVNLGKNCFSIGRLSGDEIDVVIVDHVFVAASSLGAGYRRIMKACKSMDRSQTETGSPSSLSILPSREI